MDWERLPTQTVDGRRTVLDHIGHRGSRWNCPCHPEERSYEGSAWTHLLRVRSVESARPTDRGSRPRATQCGIGWQWDILPDSPGLHFHPPVAGDSTHPLTGLVRSDITVDAPTHTIPLGHRVGGSQALGYPVANPADPANVLTVRDGPLAPRVVVPRAAWQFG